ncbi:MFS transporter [Cohnella sp. GCM10020058]|uniref:MFS transporter n=1 Tax=Cohnella sp. GCM10020058 TaxID=3317330 RepID=UPI003633E604
MATHIVSLTVKNRPGVLASVSELFGRIGCNIERLSVRSSRTPAIARMKVAVSIEAGSLDGVTARLAGLLDVLQVKTRARRHWREPVAIGRTSAFWIVAYSLFITLFGTNLPAPLYALYRAQWHLPPAVMTLLFAAYALVVIPVILVAGPLSDRIGRGKLLLSGILFALLGSVCFLIADGPVMLALSRMLQGVSVGIMNGVAVASMTELGGVQARTRAALAGSAAVTAGNALGPVVSGFLGELSAHPTRLPFALHAILVFPSIVGLWLIGNKGVRASGKMRIRLPAVPRAIRPALYMAAGTSFISWSIMSLVTAILPAYLPDIVGESSLIASGVGLALVLGLSAWAQIRSNRFPLLVNLTVGYLLLASGLAGLIGAAASHSPALLALSAVMLGLGHGPCYARSLRYVNESVPDEYRAQAVSIYYGVTYLGVSLPILGLGIVAQRLGLLPAICLFAGVTVGLMAWSLHRWRRHLA